MHRWLSRDAPTPLNSADRVCCVDFPLNRVTNIYLAGLLSVGRRIRLLIEPVVSNIHVITCAYYVPTVHPCVYENFVFIEPVDYLLEFVFNISFLYTVDFGVCRFFNFHVIASIDRVREYSKYWIYNIYIYIYNNIDIAVYND